MILITYVCMYVCMFIYQIAHNRAIRPCHPSHSMPLALILPRGDQCGTCYENIYVACELSIVQPTREKPTVILYTYINRHAGAPNKTKQKQRST